MHSSVRIRMGKDGLGYDDKGTYDSEALQGWIMHGIETDPETPVALGAPGLVGKMKGVVWKKAAYPERNVKAKEKGARPKVEQLEREGPRDLIEIKEDPLGDFERTVLKLWPEIQRDFDSVVPKKHEQSVNKAHTYPATQNKRQGSQGGRQARDSGTGSTGSRDGLRLVTEHRRSETS